METAEAPYLRAVMAPARAKATGGFAVARDAWEALRLEAGSKVIVLPIE